MTSLASAPQLVSNHGRAIYAYTNIRTNQVIYSLSRSLQGKHALKQLAFAGRNTVPQTLRKDVWHPFFAVAFPTKHQGLKAYQRLTDWKKLHELSWDPADLKPRVLPVMEQTLKDERDERDKELGPKRRGGTRQRVSDSRWGKSRIIMDQKANSVADLAAVLQEQVDRPSERWAASIEVAARASAKRAENFRSWAIELLQPGRLETLQNELDSLSQLIAEGKENGLPNDSESATRLAGLKANLKRVELSKSKLEYVRMVLNAARLEAPPIPAPKNSESTAALAKIPVVVPDWFFRMQPYEPQHLRTTEEPTQTPGTRGVETQKLARQPSTADESILYAFENGITMTEPQKNVQIHWKQPLDAEYAEAWPREVQHTLSQVDRHTSRLPDASTSFTISVSPWAVSKQPLSLAPLPTDDATPRKHQTPKAVDNDIWRVLKMPLPEDQQIEYAQLAIRNTKAPLNKSIKRLLEETCVTETAIARMLWSQEKPVPNEQGVFRLLYQGSKLDKDQVRTIVREAEPA